GSAAALPQGAFSQSVSITASADTVTSGDYKYDTLDDGTIEITKYSGKATKLTVPEKIDGKTVTVIGSLAFSDNTMLKSVTVSGSIKAIDASAFRDCTALTTVTLKKGVKRIEGCAFAGCTALENISAPNTLEYVGWYALHDTKWFKNQQNAGNEVILAGCLIKCNATGDYTIPSTVRVICDVAFSEYSPTSVTIPSSVTKICGFAFYECYNLTSVSIPASVTSIEEKAFFDCSSLESIKVASANKNYCTVNGILYDKNKTTLIQCPVSKTSVTLPSTVKTIYSSAFAYCGSLTSITLPNGLTSIGGSAFYHCYSLTKVSLPDSVTVLDGYVFNNCTSLKTVKLPSKLKKIESGLFYNCTALTSVNIPDSVTEIGMYAFYNCKSIKTLTLPKTITSVEEQAVGFIRGSDGYAAIDPNFTLKCYKDSAAERYGYTSGIKYILIDSTVPEGYPRSGAYKLDSTALIPFSVTDKSYGIFGNDKNNGVYVLNNSKLYFISAANGKTKTVYDFSAAKGDQLTSSYACGSKLYASGSHYDYTSKKYIYSIYVYDLDAKKLLSTLPYSSQVSAVGADTSGNIFVYANSKLSKLNSTGKLICETAMENAIYRFTGYDTKKGYLYYEGYYDYLYWGYHHSMTGLFAATVTSKGITVNNKCISMLYQNYFYDHNKSSDLLGGKYLVFNNGSVNCVDSNSFDITGDELKTM
ncbi:MAG: leucine-rich repeat domain-containing protein, partial [Ruminococcus sp.]|nr:leucine-rich repeat domain-containing protein [Ruminococcus sp.]